MQVQFKDNHGFSFPSSMLKKKKTKKKTTTSLFFMLFSFEIYKSTLSFTVPSALDKQQNRGMLKQDVYA